MFTGARAAVSIKARPPGHLHLFLPRRRLFFPAPSISSCSSSPEMAAALVALACVCSLVFTAHAEAPYKFFDWNVTYGDINPLGAPQQVSIYMERKLRVFDL